MLFPAALYCLFALLSVVGAFLAVAHLRSVAAGLVAALVTLLFFAALAWWLVSILSEAGFLQ